MTHDTRHTPHRCDIRYSACWTGRRAAWRRLRSPTSGFRSATLNVTVNQRGHQHHLHLQCRCPLHCNTSSTTALTTIHHSNHSNHPMLLLHPCPPRVRPFGSIDKARPPAGAFCRLFSFSFSFSFVNSETNGERAGERGGGAARSCGCSSAGAPHACPAQGRQSHRPCHEKAPPHRPTFPSLSHSRSLTTPTKAVLPLVHALGEPSQRCSELIIIIIIILI